MGLCSSACNSSGSGDGDCHKCVESGFPNHIPVLCIAGNCEPRTRETVILIDPGGSLS